MNKYQKAKARARQRAIEWQIEASEKNYSYSELVAFSASFEALGRRYGLLGEFRENGIV